MDEEYQKIKERNKTIESIQGKNKNISQKEFDQIFPKIEEGYLISTSRLASLKSGNMENIVSETNGDLEKIKRVETMFQQSGVYPMAKDFNSSNVTAHEQLFPNLHQPVEYDDFSVE